MQRGRKIFTRYLPLLRIFIRLLQFFPRRISYALLAVTRNTPGFVGLGIRYCLVYRLLGSCGENVVISSHVFLTHLEGCQIGNNVSIREFCSIGGAGKFKIGDDVSIAHSSSILTTEHDYGDTTIPTRSAPIKKRSVEIGSNVWIGAGVRILAGVIIGEGSVVGAGAVVTKSIPPNSVAVGVPARVTRRIGIRENN